MSLFDLGSDLCPEAVALVEKSKALTKCVPEDREDLAAEKKQWMNEWTLAMGAMAKCRLDGKTYSLALVLPPAENAAGLEASKMYDCWTEQIKCEQEKLATAADEKGKEKEVAVVDVPMKEVTGGDAEGTVAPLASTEGTLLLAMPQAKDWLLQSRYFSKCKAKTAAKMLPTAGDSGSGKAGSEVTTGGPPEAAIELTEGEEMDMGEVTRQVAEDSDMEDEMQGLMKEMAASMKYLHGYLDHIKKVPHVHMSLSPVVVPPVRQIRVNERSRKMRLE
ncbi:hypothetical protein BDR07DRAFT_1384245 [Suillus spraguei]|nr:hypothetical protein BDR07DRAFT_1384245 [Suillus spraguei]